MSFEFVMSLEMKLKPWPFSWGPFGRGTFPVLGVKGLKVFISRKEDGVLEPVKFVRFSTSDGSMTVVDMTTQIPQPFRTSF